MNRTTQTEEAQIQNIYSQLCLLGLLLHITQAIIFYTVSYQVPAVYNSISAVFYVLILYTSHRKMYRMTVCSVHIETCIFALFCVVFCGWGTGVALYLLAMSSLVYFCPFSNKFIPYIFSLAELTVFVALRLYTYYNDPLYGYLPKSVEIPYYIFNIFACFCIILFAAYSSNISAMVTNIQLRIENKDLSEIANSDFLTGLPSRRAFLQRVTALSPDTQVVAAIGDLDNFKTINDSFGHSSGDYVLKTVGHLINSGCNQYAIPCRWGGEEFVILFHNCSPSDTVIWLEKLRSQICAYSFEHEEQAIDVTITFGAYSGTIHEGVEKLIAEADKYLYKGKHHGKNCVVSPLQSNTP